MTATLAQIRDAIHAKLSGVAGVGVVHKFERYLKKESELKAAYVAGGVLKGWYIRRVSTAEISRAVNKYLDTHRWRIAGYMAIDDATQSEIAFDTLIEAIRDAFRVDETLSLGGTLITIVDNEIGVQLQDSGPVMFAGVLCHSARFALATRINF